MIKFSSGDDVVMADLVDQVAMIPVPFWAVFTGTGWETFKTRPIVRSGSKWGFYHAATDFAAEDAFILITSGQDPDKIFELATAFSSKGWSRATNVAMAIRVFMTPVKEEDDEDEHPKKRPRANGVSR